MDTTTTTDGPAARWTPRPRPDWVTELNTLGTNRNSPAALVSLDEASLLATATEVAGGLDDFGDDAWREPFRILVDDMHNVSDLTLIGRLLCRNELLRSLTARLQITATYAQHPEIDGEVIEQPVFIAGMARSGTTILLELLAEDPTFRAALTGELLYPCPPPEAATRTTDPRLAMAGADLGMWDFVTPEFPAIHENRGDAPNECHVGMLHEFTSPIWGATQYVPNYDRWLAMRDGSQGYRFHRRLLKLLQWRSPGRWLLKGPGHLSTLPALFAEYPDARVIVTHRDPLKTTASLVSLMATMRWQRSDTVDFARIVQVASMSNYLWDIVMEQRRSGQIPDDRIVDVQYRDLMKDPIATLRQTYERLGLTLAPDAERRMGTYLEAKPKDRHGVHRYSFDDLGLDRAAVRQTFAAYMEHYGVEEEP
jgi:hypothetical protein